jgi:predicted ATPase
MYSDLVSPQFIGREAELATLTAALGSAVAGTPTVVLLGGEAGVGKTRLVEEAAMRARAAGARVLAGSCIELGGEGLAFGPLAHAFRTLMRDTEPDELEALLSHGRRGAGLRGVGLRAADAFPRRTGGCRVTQPAIPALPWALRRVLPSLR